MTNQEPETPRAPKTDAEIQAARSQELGEYQRIYDDALIALIRSPSGKRFEAADVAKTKLVGWYRRYGLPLPEHLEKPLPLNLATRTKSDDEWLFTLGFTLGLAGAMWLIEVSIGRKMTWGGWLASVPLALISAAMTTFIAALAVMASRQPDWHPTWRGVVTALVAILAIVPVIQMVGPDLIVFAKAVLSTSSSDDY